MLLSPVAPPPFPPVFFSPPSPPHRPLSLFRLSPLPSPPYLPPPLSITFRYSPSLCSLRPCPIPSLRLLLPSPAPFFLLRYPLPSPPSIPCFRPLPPPSSSAPIPCPLRPLYLMSLFPTPPLHLLLPPRILSFHPVSCRRPPFPPAVSWCRSLSPPLPLHDVAVAFPSVPPCPLLPPPTPCLTFPVRPPVPCFALLPPLSSPCRFLCCPLSPALPYFRSLSTACFAAPLPPICLAFVPYKMRVCDPLGRGPVCGCAGPSSAC